MPNGLEICMSFNINNKLIFLCPSLNGLVTKLGKDNFKYLSYKFDYKLSDLVKQ